MGKRKSSQQEQMFLPTARGEGHRFYQALDKLLRDADFDAKVEALCEPHYAAADQSGRPSLAPGIFFRMMLVGYFEGIASERGICWRCADSISLRDFLGLANHVSVPDQSTVSRTRRRLPAVVFEEVQLRVVAKVDNPDAVAAMLRHLGLDQDPNPDPTTMAYECGSQLELAFDFGA